MRKADMRNHMNKKFILQENSNHFEFKGGFLVNFIFE